MYERIYSMSVYITHRLIFPSVILDRPAAPFAARVGGGVAPCHRLGGARGGGWRASTVPRHATRPAGGMLGPL